MGDVGRRARAWSGVIGLVAVSFLAFESAARFHVAWSQLSAAAPYLLLVLAAVNLTRSAVRSTAALVGPAFMAPHQPALYRSSVVQHIRHAEWRRRAGDVTRG